MVPSRRAWTPIVWPGTTGATTSSTSVYSRCWSTTPHPPRSMRVTFRRSSQQAGRLSGYTYSTGNSAIYKRTFGSPRIRNVGDNLHGRRRASRGRLRRVHTCSRCPHLKSPCQCHSRRLGPITTTITITYSTTQWDIERCTTISHTTTCTRLFRSRFTSITITMHTNMRLSNVPSSQSRLRAQRRRSTRCRPPPAVPVEVPTTSVSHAYSAPAPLPPPVGALPGGGAPTPPVGPGVPRAPPAPVPRAVPYGGMQHVSHDPVRHPLLLGRHR